MKALWTFTLLAIFLWCSPLSAEYCLVKSDGEQSSCTYKIDRIPFHSQIYISYKQKGWSMMIVVFRDEFAMIEGDSKVEVSKGEMQDIEYVSTRRDVAGRGVMEAITYTVSEALLHELGNSKGKVRFYLSADEPKEVEVKVPAARFSDIDAYITETKMVFGDLLEDE